jgi:hypothetical protein
MQAMPLLVSFHSCCANDRSWPPAATKALRGRRQRQLLMGMDTLTFLSNISFYVQSFSVMYILGVSWAGAGATFCKLYTIHASIHLIICCLFLDTFLYLIVQCYM